MANINISQILIKRGNTAAAGNYIGPLGELVVDTGLRTIRVQDGVTAGGMAVLATLTGFNQLSGNIANLQTTTANISANLSAFRTYANATFGTSNFGNANVAAYLVANPQGGIYSNANVASYLTTSNIITGIDANVTAANLQITNLWSNAGVQSANIATLTANAGVQADAIAGANAAIITANTALKGYVDTQLSTLTNGASTALDTLLEIGTALGNNANFSATMVTWLGNVTANTTAANTAIDTLQANLGGYYNWANANVAGLYGSITGANTAWQSNAGIQADAIASLTANAGVQSANIATLQTQVYANANVAGYLPVYSGNVQADYVRIATALITNGASPAPYISGFSSISTVGSAVNEGNITASGNLVASRGAYITGNITTAANVVAPNYLFANGVNILSTITPISSYSNTNVAAYLSASTTGNVGAGNLTVVNNFSTNVISANSFTYANGTSILDGIGGTYSNTNVSAYLSSQNITSANIGGLYNSITGANAVIQTLSANVGGFYTWANANFGTSSYANANVAAYIAGNLSTINANITGANAAIVTANSALKSYTDNQITTANTALKGYVDAGNTTMTSYVGNQITTANTALKGYVDAGNTTQSNQINSINANIGGYYTWANANVAGLSSQITGANAVISVLQANVGSYYIWANANVAGLSSQITGANAVISVLQANVGSYYTWANANVAGLQTSITSLATNANANTAAYLAANISTNIGTTGTVYAGNITVNGQPTTYGYVNGAYLLAQNNADQSAGQNVAVNFQTTSASNGSIITKTSNSQVTLTGGNTYKLEAIVRRMTSSSTWGTFRWYDVTNAAYVGVEGFTEVVNSSGAIGSTNVATAYVTPSVNTTYELRQTTVNTITVSANYATIEITQVNPTIAVQATATGTVSKNYAKYTRTASQSVSANSVIVCNVSESSSGTAVSVDTGTGQVTLTAGTYRLRGTAGTTVGGAAASLIGYGWYNETTSAWIGEGAGWVSPASTNYNISTNGTAEAVITVASTTVVSLRVISATNVTSIGGNQSDFAGTYANPWIDIEQIGSTFALNALDTISTTGNVSVGGNLAVTGTVTGSNLTGKTTGSWTVATGTGTYSITVPINGNYQLWVRCNIPNGIISYQATVIVTNTNVPVLGTQRAWNYTGGGSPILITSIPGQIVGTEGGISTATASTTTANRFDFGINNTSGSSQTVLWGYVVLS